MNKAIFSFFEKLNANKINYVIWKSTINTEQFLSGKTDIDILVSSKHSKKFLSILYETGFIKSDVMFLENYPAIEHYYKYDETDDLFVHIHVHYKIIYGFKFVKDYHLPIEDMVLDLKRVENGIFFVSWELEFIIYLLRKESKRRFFQSLNNFFSNLGDKEFRYIISKVIEKKLVRTLNLLKQSNFISERDKKVFMEIYKSKVIKKADFSKLRKINKRFRRISYIGKFFRFNIVRAYNWYLRFIKRKSKKISTGGITIAVIGVDGSGKSTISKEIYESFSKFVKVEHIYLGATKSKNVKYYFFLFLKELFGVCDYLFNEKLNVRKGKVLHFFKELDVLGIQLFELFLAKMRLKNFQKGIRKASNGAIVIFERFPLKNSLDYYVLERNYYDKKITIKSYVLSFLSNLISKKIVKKYEKIYYPDLIFYLRCNDLKVIKKRRNLSEDQFNNIKVKNKSIVDFLSKNKINNLLKIECNKEVSYIKKNIIRTIWKNL